MHWRTMSAAATAAVAVCAAASAAPRGDIRIDDTHVYPESLSATADGTVYVGSIKGVVFRAEPGSKMAEPWVQPEGVLSILGVLADPANRTLWLCSTPNNFRNPPIAGTSALMALDLKTGKQKGAWPFPAPASACNDITVAKDGTAYATDTPNGRIFTLKRGAKALELFAEDARLKGIDGIAFSGDGTLYANIVSKGQLVRIDRGADGKFSGVTVLELSQPVAGPDGFRLISGKRFLLAEGNGGKIDEATIEGDHAAIKVLKEGLLSPPGVTMAGKTAYAIEGKITYLIDPKLKGQEPGPFLVHAIPLP
ncbi:MAG: SMP-30/gluconolactonase/LRE family protein [Caulobacteraceae bacterium]